MVRVRPEEAIRLRGLRKDWIAEQMEISPSYLSMLLSGSRRWTENLQRRFALAVGISSDAICFAQRCTEYVQVENVDGTVSDHSADPPSESDDDPGRGADDAAA